MKVRELIQWLTAFEDQDATVEVLEHTSNTSYYTQGGERCIRVVSFEPTEHTTYTDLRGNPYIKPDSAHFEARTLLLGTVDA